METVRLRGAQRSYLPIRVHGGKVVRLEAVPVDTASSAYLQENKREQKRSTCSKQLGKKPTL